VTRIGISFAYYVARQLVILDEHDAILGCFKRAGGRARGRYHRRDGAGGCCHGPCRLGRHAEPLQRNPAALGGVSGKADDRRRGPA
jgi:hypothetical protein